MEKSGQQQQQQQMGKKEEIMRSEEGRSLEDGVPIPLKTSPYTQYSDLEDYKRQGYGTEGHLEPKTGRGAGSTDGPTPSGDHAPHSKFSATDPINRQGVP